MRDLFRRQPLLRVLSSLKLTLVLLLVSALAAAVATFLEAEYGAEGARALVYNAHWFEAILILLMVNLVLRLLARIPYRAEQAGFLIVHLAIIVILAGAGITRCFGYEGVMSIREGQSSSQMLTHRDYLSLRAGEDETAWALRLYRPGDQGRSRTLKLGGERYRAELNQWWPHMETGLAAGEGGVPALLYAASGGEGMERDGLRMGESRQVGAVRVSFLEGELPPARDAGDRGEVKVTLDGQSGFLPVSLEDGSSLELGGMSFRVTEFHADFARREERPEPTEMRNPMVRVAVDGPEGPLGERILFAFFPDFSMGHSGAEDPLEGLGLDLSYRYERGLQVVLEDGALRARAGFPLERGDMSGGDGEIMPAGTAFPLEEGALLKSGEFTFALMEYLPEAVMAPRPSENPRLPAGLSVTLSGPGGEKAEAVLLRGSMRGQALSLGGREITVTFGPRSIDLPYTLHLDDFVLITYPGSQNPAGFESHVRLSDPEKGILDRPVRIHMNHPLTHRGNKHFQSSYDPDRLGTVLSVNHDPGRLPTYFGYALITLGFVLVFAKRLIWRRSAKENS